MLYNTIKIYIESAIWSWYTLVIPIQIQINIFFKKIKLNEIWSTCIYLFLLKCWCLILNHFVFLKLTCPLVIYFTYETFNLMIKLIKNMCTCVKMRIAMWMQRQIESIIWRKKTPKTWWTRVRLIRFHVGSWVG